MATTIKRIYTLALAKIIEAPGTDVDFDSYSPTLLDSLLVEALPDVYKRQEYKSADKAFEFPNGSRLKFGYCRNDSDLLQYLSLIHIYR